jgi:hypothetical protein
LIEIDFMAPYPIASTVINRLFDSVDGATSKDNPKMRGQMHSERR